MVGDEVHRSAKNYTTFPEYRVWDIRLPVKIGEAEVEALLVKGVLHFALISYDLSGHGRL